MRTCTLPVTHLHIHQLILYFPYFTVAAKLRKLCNSTNESLGMMQYGDQNGAQMKTAESESTFINQLHEVHPGMHF